MRKCAGDYCDGSLPYYLLSDLTGSCWLVDCMPVLSRSSFIFLVDDCARATRHLAPLDTAGSGWRPAPAWQALHMLRAVLPAKTGWSS